MDEQKDEPTLTPPTQKEAPLEVAQDPNMPNIPQKEERTPPLQDEEIISDTPTGSQELTIEEQEPETLSPTSIEEATIEEEIAPTIQEEKTSSEEETPTSVEESTIEEGRSPTIQEENSSLNEETPTSVEETNIEEEVAHEEEEVAFSESTSQEPLASTPQEEETSAPEEVSVDFNFLDIDGRWLLKVIAGPNTGAEFSLHGGSSYIIGTDAAQCDIIFHDMSISRKHAKITIDARENALIEDIDSKNGIFIDGQKVSSYQVKGNVMVTLGTTTFALIDRTEEQKTISTPKNVEAPQTKEIPPVPKEAPVMTPEKQMETIREAAIPSLNTEVEKIKEESEGKKEKFKKSIRIASISFIILLILIGIGIGATSLFETEAVKSEAVLNPQELISQALKPYSAVRFSYNPSNKHLLLVGHVLTAEDQSRMLDVIQQFPFVTEINSSGVVIDEFVWAEINQILAKNPAWRGISISSPEAGKFVLSGFLKTRAMNEELLTYLSQNFNYMNLLDQKIVIEEDLLAKIRQELSKAGCQGVKPALSNGELVLTGAVSFDKKETFEHLIEEFRGLAGIRGIQSQVVQSGESQAIVDLTGKYTITGYSQQRGNTSVVVNGRIVGRGDILDGMLIVDITPTTIFLEHDGVTYKIDYIK